MTGEKRAAVEERLDALAQQIDMLRLQHMSLVATVSGLASDPTTQAQLDGLNAVGGSMQCSIDDIRERLERLEGLS